MANTKNNNIDNYENNEEGAGLTNFILPNDLDNNFSKIDSNAGVANDYKNDKPLPGLATNEPVNNNENNNNENNNNDDNNDNNENNENDENNDNNDNNDNDEEPVAAAAAPAAAPNDDDEDKDELEEDEDELKDKEDDDDDDDDNDDDNDDDDNDNDDDNDDDDDDDDDDDELKDDDGNDDGDGDNEEKEKPIKNTNVKKTNIVSPETLEKILNVNANVVPASQEEQLLLDEDEDYKKLLKNFNKNDLVLMHKEREFKNFDEIVALSHVVRNKDNQIVDELHQTIPFMTKYEKTRILGKRVKQLNDGMPPFVELKKEFVNNYFVAEAELYQKRIPLIIERPLPNGAFEYWKVKDLELL